MPELNGKVHFVGATETVGMNGFRKRLLVLDVTDNPKYPNMVPIEFTQDSVSKLDGVQVGSFKSVSYDPRGREHSGKYYVNLRGWRMQDGVAPPELGNDVVSPNDSVQGGNGAKQDQIPF